MPLPWQHAALRQPLLKTFGLAGLALMLAALEFANLLTAGVRGFFPGLLALGAFFLGMGLMRLREQVLDIHANAREIHIWEGPIQERALAQAEQAHLKLSRSGIAGLSLAESATGRTRSQPVLQFQRQNDAEAVNLGSGLPKAELAWLKAELEDWLRIQT